MGNSHLSNPLFVFLRPTKKDKPEPPLSFNCDSILSLIGDVEISEIRSSQGYSSLDHLISIPWKKLDPEFINIQFRGALRRDTRALRSCLQSNGYGCLGSGREQTGTDALFTRCSGKLDQTSSLLTWFWFNLGQKVVRVRENLFDSQSNQVRLQRVARFLGWQKSVPLLDHDFGLSLSKVDPLKSQSIANQIAGLSLNESVPIQFDAESEQHRVDVAVDACYDEFGVWPISFSIPDLYGVVGSKKLRTISEVIPGNSYAFSKYEDYLEQYTESLLAITHRKAGWDCFRHIEILAARSLPYMLDTQQIPRYSMVHYPKILMDSVAKKLESGLEIPVVPNAEELSEYLESTLTCESMARYVLRASSLQNATRVLFVDENLVKMADYLSLFTLIGMKQLHGDNCAVFSPVPYVYSNWQGDSKALYGRGFGYTRILESSMRGANELTGGSLDLNQISDLEFDAVIVGNITRNSALACKLLSIFPAKNTIWIHGEDTPPLVAETKFLLDSGVNVFVRAIH